MQLRFPELKGSHYLWRSEMLLLPLLTQVIAAVQVTSQQFVRRHNPSLLPFNHSQNNFLITLKSPKEDTIQELFLQTIGEVFSGPLNGKSIAIALDALADQQLNAYQLLSSIPTPFILLREREDLQQDISHTEHLGEVLVYVNTGEKCPILDSPPTSWSLTALLIVSVSENCDENLLQTELATRTSSLAVMCPTFVPSAKMTVGKPSGFDVQTWQPFHPRSKRLYIGRWSSNSSWDDFFVDRFRSFHGTILQLASDNGDVPYFYAAEDGTMDGINKRLLDALGAWLNFSYVPTQEVEDLKYGTKINGTWDGFLGEIWSGAKDLTSFDVNYERAKDFDFTQPHSYEGYGFAIRNPSPLPRWQSIIYPFTPIVWGALLLTVFVTPATFYLIQLKADQMSYTKCLLLITKSLVNQGVEYRPKTIVSRIFLATWWFSAYITGIIYACNLISFFTVPVYPNKITTIKQIAESPYRLCMLDYSTFVTEELSKTSQPLLSALGRKLDLAPVDMNKKYFGQEECVERMMESPSVHLEFMPFLQSAYSQMGITEKVYFIEEAFFMSNVVIFTKKHNAWMYKLDQGIRRTVEAGLVRKWDHDVKKELGKNAKVTVEDSDDRPLSLLHLQGPFLILIITCSVSLFVFFLELAFK